MKLITSRANSTFKQFKLLAEESREQRRSGTSLLEGVHLVASYRDKRGLPERLIVSEHGAMRPDVQALIDTLPGVETLLLSDNLFGELSELATPVGVAAIIRIPQPAAAKRNGSCILLDALQDPGNVGSILRSAAAAEIADIYLGPGCAGVWTPRVLRAAQGAHFDLQLHEQADLGAVMSAFAGTSVAATAQAAEPLFQMDLRGRLAWLFGSEGSGIAPALEAAANKRVNIPLAPGSESLNVAAAAAICLFEQVRQNYLSSAP